MKRLTGRSVANLVPESIRKWPGAIPLCILRSSQNIPLKAKVCKKLTDLIVLIFGEDRNLPQLMVIYLNLPNDFMYKDK